jgi:hypothetical protein
MTTHCWKTISMAEANNMNNKKKMRPQIYVHVEFGVTWTGQNPPRMHDLTYRSKGLRDRSPNFPRQVPAPTTNFLAAPTESPYQRDHHVYHGYYGREAWRYRNNDVQEEEMARRSTRAETSRSSQERGHSAPPPFGQNPWDVNVSQQPRKPVSAAPMPVPSSSTSAPAAAPRKKAQVPNMSATLFKELPEVPARFRLGSDGMPWSAWSWPYGYEPDAYPADDDDDEEDLSGGNFTAAPEDRPHTAHPLVSNPTQAAFYSPGIGVAVTRDDNEVPTRADKSQQVRDLEALSAAMMTVDNGFENQWWYQGQREMTRSEPSATTPATNRLTTTTNADTVVSTHPPDYLFSPRYLGWAVATPTPQEEQRQRQQQGQADLRYSQMSNSIVSPVTDITEYDDRSSATPTFNSLGRSGTRKSDELFMK